MPRVNLYQSGAVQQGPANTAPLQPGNFGESGLGQGLETAGNAMGELANTQDQIQAIHDQQQAQQLSLQHLETQKQLTQTVYQAQGMNAMPVAQQAADDLKRTNGELLSQARSGRARLMLQQDIIPRSTDAMTAWEGHAFEQQKTAVIATNTALTASTINTAAALPDEGQARAMMAKADDYTHQQQAFLGQSDAVAAAAKRNNWTQFFVSRATQMASDPSGGRYSEAIQYLRDNRDQIDNNAYNGFVSAYHERALKGDAHIDVDLELARMGDPHAGLGRNANGVAGGPSPSGMVKPDGTLDIPTFFANGTGKWEGGYTIDVNGYPVNHGINGQFHPGVDIRHITNDQAAGIFAKDYAAPYAHLSAPLAAVLMDTAFISPDEAKRIYAQVGASGDPQQAMDLREHWMKSLEVTNPAKYGPVAQGWNNRNRQLRNVAAQMMPAPTQDQAADSDQPPGQRALVANDNADGAEGGAAAATAALSGTAPAPAPVPVAQQNRAQPPQIFNWEDLITRIRSNPQYSPEMKDAMITDARERRSEEFRARQQNDDDTERTLMSNAVNLNHNFTDVGQLDQHAWQLASPNTRQRLQTMAEANARGENVPLKPTDAAWIAEVKRANPQYYMSDKFQSDAAARGIPLRVLTQVASDAGTMRGEAMAQSPKYLRGQQMWSVVKPMFEQQGIFLDSTETGRGDKSNRTAERQADAQSRLNAYTYLENAEKAWAEAPGNAGKVPDVQTIRMWGAHALMTTNSGQRAFDQVRNNPAEFVGSIAPDLRTRLVQGLKAHGYPATPQNIRNSYMRLLGRRGGPGIGSQRVNALDSYTHNPNAYGDAPTDAAPDGQ